MADCAARNHELVAVLDVFRISGDIPRLSGVRVDSIVYQRVDSSGVRRDLVRLPGERLYFRITGNGFDVMPLPFAREPVVKTLGNRSIVAWSVVPRLDIHTRDGALARSIRWTGTGPPLTPSDVAQYRDSVINSTDNAELGRVRPTLDVVPFPDTRPAQGALVVDSQNLLWIQTFHASGRTRETWQIFSADGAWLGALDLPKDLNVSEIGDTYILGFASDELEVQYVRLYALLRGNAEGS